MKKLYVFVSALVVGVLAMGGTAFAVDPATVGDYASQSVSMITSNAPAIGAGVLALFGGAVVLAVGIRLARRAFAFVASLGRGSVI